MDVLGAKGVREVVLLARLDAIVAPLLALKLAETVVGAHVETAVTILVRTDVKVVAAHAEIVPARFAA